MVRVRADCTRNRLDDAIPNGGMLDGDRGTKRRQKTKQDRGPELSENGRKFLTAAYRAPGIDQGRIYRLEFDQAGPSVRAGSFELRDSPDNLRSMNS